MTDDMIRQRLQSFNKDTLGASAETHARVRLREQFQHMDGWQVGQDARFDAYIAEKRLAEGFEGFDQRVERAYQTTLRLHRAEIFNGMKRRLKQSGQQFSHDVMRETQSSVKQRAEWLRDVFAQIDADYRSGDAERRQRAAEEVDAAIRGEPGDYMKFVLERKREARFLGPKGKAAFDAEFAGANMPEVSNEEANRYASLKVSMSALEELIHERFGRAGDEHWDVLQREKDAEYLAKMEQAGEKFKEFIDQQNAYDAAVGNQWTRLVADRMANAQVKFQTAMEAEEKREQLVAAHKQLEDERFEAARQRYRRQLQEAAELREQGKSTDEIARRLKMQTMQQHISSYNERGAREQSEVLQRKRKFLKMIDLLEESLERREGDQLIMKDEPSVDQMAAPGAQPGSATAPHSSASSATTLLEDAKKLAALRGDSSPAMTKKALWDVLNEDKWHDPFRMVHQARLDARATHDELYSYHKPWSLRLGKKAARGPGEFLAGGGNDHKQLNDPWIEARTFGWGASNSGWVHNADGTGKRQYFYDDMRWHVSDPVTGDVDQTEERRLGQGVRFRQKPLYKMGADAEDHPRNRTMRTGPPPKRGGVGPAPTR